jgi:hypothetical protein
MLSGNLLPLDLGYIDPKMTYFMSPLHTHEDGIVYQGFVLPCLRQALLPQHDQHQAPWGNPGEHVEQAVADQADEAG